MGYIWDIYGISPKQIRYRIGTGTEQHGTSGIEWTGIYSGRNHKQVERMLYNSTLSSIIMEC
jgi:hypothetical protein